MKVAIGALMAAWAVLALALPAWSFSNIPTFQYEITGQEALDLRASFTKEAGAFVNEKGHAVIVRMSYDSAGEANIRIRTEIECMKDQALCRVSGYHLTFIPYDEQ